MGRQPKNGNDGRDEESDEIVRIIGERLKQARLNLGLTQAQLAVKAGVSQPYIFEIERGATNITVKTLARMAGFVDMNPRDLFPADSEIVPGVSRADLAEIVRSFDNLADAVRARASQDAEILEAFRGATELRQSITRLLEASEPKDRAEGSTKESPKGPRSRSPRK